MADLLSQSTTHTEKVYRLRLESATEGLENTLKDIPGITDVEALESMSPEFRLTFDSEGTDTNTILSAVISKGAHIASFNEDSKQLNQAFMDLTTAGVREK